MSDYTSDIPWSELVPQFVGLPIKAFQQRHMLRRLVVRLQVALNRGGTRVLVLGKPGVGKSLLLSRLTHGDKSFTWRPPPPSTDAEPHVLSVGKTARLCRVVPGESSQERDRWMHEAFSTHRHLRGVIYVVDWGFTAERLEPIRRVYIDERGIDSVAKWRELNLRAELKDFEATCARLRETINRATRKPLWLLILVNKSDLFFHNLDDAQKYYHPRLDSPMGQIVRELYQSVGQNSIRVDAAPVCAWPENFEWNSEVVTSNVGGEANARALLANTLDSIARLDR